MNVTRPWGYYKVLSEEKGLYRVKLVVVSPRHRLSLQKHKNRSEHWVVVSGRAKITKEKHVYYLKRNESSYIPKNCVHRLENPTSKPLKIIEVQCGKVLRETDIVRLSDDYRRVRRPLRA
ncbi:MAG: phosphomannose isomerase type II C-terminal cupin domain [Candidatus Omnitrophota bacterium]|nr:phosphomannose isomerase type II C-terminal cupin domain [Candidatus Omnitrophota bacterium]